MIFYCNVIQLMQQKDREADNKILTMTNQIVTSTLGLNCRIKGD